VQKWPNSLKKQDNRLLIAPPHHEAGGRLFANFANKPMLDTQEDADKSLLSESEGDFLTLENILHLMAKWRASDCFISVGSLIKFKIEGRQVPLSSKRLAKDDIDIFLAEGLDSSQLDLLDKTRELNCAISMAQIGRFRVSAFVQRNTKSIVIRFIPPDVPEFETLFLPPILKDIIMLKRGLVLVVGPTGSGKSTSLASLIDYRNTHRADHILTIEDPIEFLYRHRKSVVNQREVGTDALSYQEALKNAMRQAPDVILIGEIRDQDTMRMAMQYAQSGHLCLATMHANNSYHALNRIVGFYPPDNRDALFPDLSSSLKAIVAQRLVPGFDGSRLPAVEVLINSRPVQDLIKQGKIDHIAELMERLSSDGTQTFEQVLVELVAAKRISVDTALIHSDSPTNLFWRLSQKGLSVSEEVATSAGVDRSDVLKAKAGQTHSDSDQAPEKSTPKQESASFGNFTIDASGL
jgi:twitching motility protein PilU